MSLGRIAPGREVEVGHDALGPEDDTRPEEVRGRRAGLDDQQGDVVGPTQGRPPDVVGRAVVEADGLVDPFDDLVGAEPLDLEDDGVGDAVDADNPAGDLEVLGGLGQVRVGGVGGAGATGQCQHPCDQGGGEQLESHVRSFDRRE